MSYFSPDRKELEGKVKLKYATVLVHDVASVALHGDVEIPDHGQDDVPDLPGLPETQVPSAITFPLTSPTILMFS